MAVFQIALCIFTGYFFDRIDEKHFPAFLEFFVCSANQNTRFHRCIKEQVGSKSDYAIYEVALYEFLPHFLFFVSEKNAVREQNSASAGVRIQALNNVL